MKLNHPKKLKKLLTAAGLSSYEAKVYITLLEHGNLTVAAISRISELHRPAIYSVIPLLQSKGLVNSRLIGKQTRYNAESPNRLSSLLKNIQAELDTVIPQLHAIRNANTPIVRRLDGKEGIYAVYEDIVHTLKKGEEFYRYNAASHEDLQKIGLPESYEQMRDEKQLERLVISNPDYIASREPSLEESLRVVPENFWPFEYNVSQIIYGNKIAFIDYTEPIATIIENPTLAQFQKDIFKMLFRKLEPAAQSPKKKTE